MGRQALGRVMGLDRVFQVAGNDRPRILRFRAVDDAGGTSQSIDWNTDGLNQLKGIPKPLKALLLSKIRDLHQELSTHNLGLGLVTQLFGCSLDGLRFAPGQVGHSLIKILKDHLGGLVGV